MQVLKDGELMEMGPAHELISNNTSILASFVEETGKSTAQILKKVNFRNNLCQEKYSSIFR